MLWLPGVPRWVGALRNRKQTTGRPSKTQNRTVGFSPFFPNPNAHVCGNFNVILGKIKIYYLTIETKQSRHNMYFPICIFNCYRTQNLSMTQLILSTKSPHFSIRPIRLFTDIKGMTKLQLSVIILLFQKLPTIRWRLQKPNLEIFCGDQRLYFNNLMRQI